MDKIKVLFADIYRLHSAMKGELKIISKSNEQFLLARDDQKANMTASDIIKGVKADFGIRGKCLRRSRI